jgi:N4-gp56 family major capsid protein|uniref:Major capsid protein n=1 Tax=Podoviridae sp. ctHMt20 TaxID=2827728 RepID=A0A8S5SLI4_9CAUD|nr:MAG TPA: major capsid protein [Podoviridae sp. ctHMt20]
MANEFKIPVNLVPKIWTKKVWKEGLKASYFDKFTSTSGDNVVHANKDLKNAKGDKVYFGLMMNLKGAGVTGNNTLKGNEEELKVYDFGVDTTLIRNAVKRFEADDQKSPYANLPMIKSALTQWLSDWKDNSLIKSLTVNPTAGERLIASTAGTEVSLTANDKLTCAVISRAKRKAMMHEPKVKPIKVDGQEKYIMLVGTWAARDLKADPVWQAAQQNAAIRGSKNPIFTGALGEYDGVVLYEYERVMNTTTGASSANVVHNLLLGQQAACFAVAREARFIHDEDDYGNLQGSGIAFYGGIVKSIYNSKDYGVIQVMTGGAVE